MVSINTLADTASKIAGKAITKKHIDGPLGVRGRNSNNDLIREKLQWDYSMSLEDGIAKTYDWINSQLKNYILFHHSV
jgi:nucleoside-diphosphate-sugar epimerase